MPRSGDFSVLGVAAVQRNVERGPLFITWGWACAHVPRAWVVVLSRDCFFPVNGENQCRGCCKVSVHVHIASLARRKFRKGPTDQLGCCLINILLALVGVYNPEVPWITRAKRTSFLPVTERLFGGYGIYENCVTSHGL